MTFPKRKALTACAIAALLATPAIAGVGEWTTTAIEGGSMFTIAIAPSAPSTVYAVSGTSGVFRSADGGATWVSKEAALQAAGATTFNARLLAVAPDDADTAYYANFQGTGIFKTTDGGDTWTALGLTGDSGGGVGVDALAFHPAAPGTVYAGSRSSNGGLFKTTDGGSTWTSLNDALMDDSGGIVRVDTLAIDPAAPATVWAAGRFQALFKSIDGGDTWTSLNDRLEADLGFSFGVRQLAIDPGASATVYARGNGLAKTTDGGDSWASLSEGLEAAFGDVFFAITAMAVDPAGSGALFVALETSLSAAPNVNGVIRRALLRSADGGATWSDVGGDLAMVTLRDLAIDPGNNQTLLASTSSGIYRTSDGGASWSESDSGLAAVLVDRLWTAPGSAPADGSEGVQGTAETTLFALDPNAGLFASDDAGATWSARDSGLTNRAVQDLAISASHPEIVYRTDSFQFSRSADGGRTWTPNIADMAPFHELFEQSVQELAVHPTNPNVLLAGNFTIVFDDGLGSNALFKSLDGGATWQAVYGMAGPPTGFIQLLPTALEFDPENPNIALALLLVFDENFDVSGAILRSTDGGATWQEVFSGVGFGEIHFGPGAVYVTAFNTFGPPGGVFKSTDGGATWTPMNNGLPAPLQVWDLAVDPADPSFLYAVARQRVYFSTDGGGNWKPYDRDGLDPGKNDFRTLELVRSESRAHLFAGFNGGVRSYAAGGCAADGETLCLDRDPGDRRFQVSLAFDTVLGGGRAGDAMSTPLDSLAITDGGILSFFDPANPEVLVKVLDGCNFNDRFWVFYAATTTAGFDLTVEDTLADASKVYSNPDTLPAATVTDTDAFATCEVGGSRVSSSDPPRADLGELAATAGSGPAGAESSNKGGCVPGATTLCIDDRPGDSRFAVRLAFDTALGGGLAGDARAIPLSPLGITKGGILWFFDASNPEVLIKVLNACDFNGTYWVFYAATTTVGFELTVEDTAMGVEKTYVNPDLMAAQTVTDTSALATCEP